MKNILSYKPGSVFSGKEIKDWISYNLEHLTSHSRQAKQMRKYLALNDNHKYTVKLRYQGTGCTEVIHHPIVVRVY